MAPVRSRIVQVKAGAVAAASAALLAVPLAAALMLRDETSPRVSPAVAVVQTSVATPTANTAQIDGLRARGDVQGLLALARTCSPDAPGSARLRASALASLGRVPTPEAVAALRALAEEPATPELDRLTALAALWERGERTLVEDLARGSADPVVRAHVRALACARR